jgi:uncharacterized protein (TIGR02147 family)
MSKEDYTGLLSKWYHVAVSSMLRLNKNYSPEFIAEKLQITKAEVEESIQFLIENKYIIRTGENGFFANDSLYKIESPVPVELIQNTHTSFAKLAANSIKKIPIEKRKYLSSVITVEKKYIAEARADIEEFFNKFANKYSCSDKADSVYCTGIQFFQLDTEE